MRQSFSCLREIGLVLSVVVCFCGFSTGAIDAQEKIESLLPLRKDKDTETFAKVKFTRLAEEAFRALAAEADPNLSEADRLLRQVQSGDWVAVRGFLKLFEPEAGRRIHSKICSDLVYANPKSTILPQDVVALADASPVELDDKQINLLSGLLRLAIRDSESRTELLALLHKGTERLGGAEVSRKRMAARMLAGADLWTDARTFGLPERDLRPGAVESPDAPTTPQNRSWDETLAVLRDRAADEAARTAALNELQGLMLTATPQTLETQLKTLFDDRSRADVTLLVCGLIGQKAVAAGREVDTSARAVHLEIQHQAMQQWTRIGTLDAEPARTLANLYANNWLLEAQFTLKTFPVWLKSANRDRLAHVPIEHVLKHAPAGRWMAAIQPQLSSMIRITLARLILLSDDIDRAVPFIRELVPHDSPAAGKLANAYLENWAHRHDPNLPPEVLKLYRLDNQVVVLTRAQQEISLKQLGALLASLDETTRKLLDETQLVRAFDFCHSRAEVYSQQHLVAAFGPIEQMSPSLLLSLFERMRNKLASQWRELSVQRDAATRRTAADVFQLVNHGYDEAAQTADLWFKAHPDDWRMNCTVGSLFSDWSEFAYFQSVATTDSGDRFATYLQHSERALNHFRAGSTAYAALVPKLKRSEFELLPYRSWFYGLLGITQDSGVNLRKGMTHDGLDEIRSALLALPGGAAEVHLELFSAMVADNISANRIAPEMKYRYLSSAVRITGRRATVYPAEEKIKFYDSLLKEIRLEARLDGSDRISTSGSFGVFVSLIHTADVARESGGFGKYVMNEVLRTASGKSIIEKPLYRDRFEEALRIALKDFFEVKSIAFADPKAGARAAELPGTTGVWQETPLAYLLLVPKDASVDRVPALEIELDFFDREGKVVVPVPSNPLQIAISSDAPQQRPASNVALTQIVDSRELAEQRLKIDVIATARGLVPDLAELLQLDGYALTVQEVAHKEGLLLRELHNGPDGLHALSERSWTIHLDPSPLLRGASQRVEFAFPPPKSADTSVTYRRYQDLDPVDAAAQITLVEGEEVRLVTQPNYPLWIGGGVGGLAALLLAVWALRRKPTVSDIVPSPFVLPRDVTPFSVIALLQRIQSSRVVGWSDDVRRSLQQDIRQLEQAAFQREAGTQLPQELEVLARRWIERAVAMTAKARS